MRRAVNLTAFLTSFGLIFVAELPDKTAYTMLLLAARGHPVQVFLGSCLALSTQALVAVGLGSLLVRLPEDTVRYASAAVFVGFGLYLLLSKPDDEHVKQPVSKQQMFLYSFGLVFLAEMGDATQLGTAALVARFRAPWSVYLGSSLALCAVALLMVTLGGTLGARLPKRALRKAGGGLFLIFAVLSLVIGR
jgi:putative Ca2+/H+ antiporter (TMEM165/GDT1 family)